MRTLLVLFLFASLVRAEAEFGPDTLDPGRHSANTKFSLLSADTLIVVWGQASGVDLPGQGQKFLIDGTQIGWRMDFANHFPHLFDRAAEVDVLRLPDGSEVDHIGHETDAHHEIQFFSSSGRLVGTREYGICSSAFLRAWESGAFFTYWTPANTQGGGHVLYWFESFSEIVLQDTLYGPKAIYAQSDSDRVSLVQLTDDWIGSQHVQSLIIHNCYSDGRQDRPDTLYTDDLSASQPLPDPAFADYAGDLVGALFRLNDSNADGDYDRVQSRLIRYRPGAAFIGEWRDFLPYAGDATPSHFNLKGLPSGEYLLGYFLGNPGNAEIRFAAMDEFGAVAPYPRRIALTADQQLSGFDVLVYNESVYYTFSTEHDAAVPDSLFNVVVGAFPIRLLEAESAFQPPAVAGSIQLSLYPNPFNGTAKIRFELPRDGNAAMTIFDVNGRQVMDLSEGFYSAGSHELSWSAEALPSGVYWLRLNTKENVQVQKALLIR